MADSRDVKDFYEGFSETVLLEDFKRVNLRQEAIKDLCGRYVPRGGRVLEIGCGVGIIAGHLKSIVGSYVGLDISARNIEIAREYVTDPKFEFRVLDVIEQPEKLEDAGRFDVVLMPDVIEHIPKERYAKVFGVIESHLEPDGVALLTFPSPEYQEYLKANDPSALQVVDETVELSDLLAHTSLKVHHFAYRDAWNRNQYVHLALVSGLTYVPGGVPRNLYWRIGYKLRKYVWRFSNASFVARIRSRFKKQR
jgi:2-polyprenyl-3-methyl-5-hydroxy-6-metoxy-1,4-benzoquinol methylase